MIITSFEGFANPPVNPDALPKLFYDYETDYTTEYSLTKMSPMEYIFDPRFRFQSVSYAYDDGEKHFIFGNDNVVKWINETPWEQVEAVAHNGEGFDHLITAWRYGKHAALWGDTLCMARPWYSNICQNALGKLAKYLGYPEKLTELHNKFRGKSDFDFTPQDIEDMRQYNDMDVEIMRRFYKDHIHLFPWYERLILDDTIRMSTELRLRVNKEKARIGVEQLEGKQRQLIMRAMDYLAELGSDIVKPLKNIDRSTELGVLQAMDVVKKIIGSGPKFAAVLEAYDIEPGMKPAKGAKAKAAIDAGLPCPETYAFAKDDDFMVELLEHDDPEIVALAELRVSVKSTQKYTRMQTFERVAHVMNGWLPARAAYCAAHTGRPGGRDYNLLNLTRNVYRGKELVEKSMLREAVEVPPGYKLVVVDLSGIELRLNHYLWLYMPSIEAWAKNRDADIYSMTGTDLFGRPISKKENPTERQVSKVLDLGSQYGAGGLVLYRQAKKDELIRDLVTRPQIETFNQIWRKTHDEIVQGWKRCQNSLPYIATGDSSYQIDPWGLLRIEKDKIRLPSGRYLFYPDLRQVDKIAKSGRVYREWVYGKGKKIYGGLCTENIVQALARDAFQEKVMLCKWKYNIRAALTVYDEMVAVVPEAQAEWVLEKMLEVFCEPISWWPQVVLFAEGDIADNYADAK